MKPQLSTARMEANLRWRLAGGEELDTRLRHALNRLTAYQLHSVRMNILAPRIMQALRRAIEGPGGCDCTACRIKLERVIETLEAA